MYTDPIADYLTRIRNAVRVRHRIVAMPSSKLKVGITQVLMDMGYINNYAVVDDNGKKVLKIALKYDPKTKVSTITELKRISRPGLRKYADANSIPRVMNGLGIAILTTSKGILTGKQAHAANVGGEVLCYVY
jgi:small subunit ribosomal protein S8